MQLETELRNYEDLRVEPLQTGWRNPNSEDKVAIFGALVAVPQTLDHCAGLCHGCSFFPTTDPHPVQM